jgi:hypothetical protein
MMSKISRAPSVCIQRGTDKRRAQTRTLDPRYGVEAQPHMCSSRGANRCTRTPTAKEQNKNERNDFFSFCQRKEKEKRMEQAQQQTAESAAVLLPLTAEEHEDSASEKTGDAHEHEQVSDVVARVCSPLRLLSHRLPSASARRAKGASRSRSTGALTEIHEFALPHSASSLAFSRISVGLSVAGR